MGFLFKAAAAALVGTITVILVLATLIESANPPADGDVRGPTYIAGWFAFLAVLWLASWAGGKALKAVLRR